MRVLVTGAAGSLGRVVTAGLAEHGHDVVGLDLVPAPEGSTFAWHEADCTDGDAVAAVFAEERLDAVVHLAGIPEESSLPDALASHVVTTAALLDAMVAHRVPRAHRRLMQELVDVCQLHARIALEVVAEQLADELHLVTSTGTLECVSTLIV